MLKGLLFAGFRAGTAVMVVLRGVFLGLGFKIVGSRYGLWCYVWGYGQCWVLGFRLVA